MHCPVVFQVSDREYPLKTLTNILILISWLILAADLIPILGLLSSAFLSMAIIYFVIFMYKSKKWNTRFDPKARWMFILLLIFGLLFFILYLVNKNDFILILARPFNILKHVPAIPSTEKLGYFVGFLVFQIIPAMIFTGLISQRIRVIWKIDTLNQTLILTFHHPLYLETRSIHFKNIKEIEFGAASPFKRLFTNTQNITITRYDAAIEIHEISLATTPIFLMMNHLIMVIQSLTNNERITLKWFRELGDYLQNSIFTKYKITEEITLPLTFSFRFTQGKKFIAEVISEQQSNKNYITHPKRGAFYRTKLGSILFFIFGICCFPVVTILASYFLKLGYQSVSFPESGYNHGFNAEILLIIGLFLIILFIGFRLLFFSLMMLFGHTTLQWTENEFLIGVQWKNFNKVDLIIPHLLICDIFPLLELLSSDLLKIWVQTPFITLPIWLEEKPDSPITNKILVNTINSVEKHSK
ncbi:MAG: hypothetical protein ACFFAJ_13400 [Candidatus Hodarchaeota archaeon]